MTNLDEMKVLVALFFGGVLVVVVCTTADRITEK